MNKIFFTTLAAAAAIVTTTAFAHPAPAPAMPQVQEQASVPEAGGDERIALLKEGKKLETVTCADFNMVDESFRPQAVVYAANYGKKHKPHPTVTVEGVASIVPVVVDACKARPGDQFTKAVNAAVKLNAGS